MSDASSSPAAAASPTPSDASNAPSPARKRRAASSERDVESESDLSNARPVGSPKRASPDEEDDAGLFGESDDEPSAPVKRTLDDEELDSGDDDGRRDRAVSMDVDEQEQRELNTVEIGLGRHPVPQGTDGELYLLRFSRSVGFQPQAFDPASFRPPRVGHHNAAPTAGFSPAQTAKSTIRWRRDADNPALLQSNTRLLRWSDGSLTLQMGSHATDQLELPAKILAPPQLGPKKPTPTAIYDRKAPSMANYDPRLDAHTYVTSIHQDTAFAQTTNHITTSLTMQANIEENDDALIRLQEQMAAMSKGYAKADQAAGPGVLSVIEDPERAKREAENAERERLKAQKRRETQEQKMRDRQNGVLARAGLRNTYNSALGEVEGLAAPRSRKPARKPRRRGSEYSDEDDYRGRRTREDDYDEDDGFVAGSDEEVEYVDDDDADDLDRGMESGVQDEAASPRPARSPKRAREDDDEAGGGGGGKRGRRQVLDDDDDD